MNLSTPFVYLFQSLIFFINLEPFILFLLTALIDITIEGEIILIFDISIGVYNGSNVIIKELIRISAVL